MRRRWIIRGRGQGKTTDLLTWLMNPPDGIHHVLLTFTAQEADRLRKENPIRSPRSHIIPFSKRIQLTGLVRGDLIRVAIDNIELVLDLLVGYRVEIVSMTPEELIK